MDRSSKIFVLLTTLATPLSILAVPNSSAQNVDVSLAVGPACYTSPDSTIQIHPSEVDTTAVNTANNAALYRAGVGYHFFHAQLHHRKFINDLLAQVNYYHSSSTIKGDVLQNGAPGASNFTFSAPINTDRLMLDIKPSLFTYHHVSPYLVAGAGVAWNRVSYSETANSPSYAPYATSLPSASQTATAYDLGFGIDARITHQLYASVEYLWTHLGNATPNNVSTTRQATLAVPTFSTASQSVLFGLGWKF